MAGAPGSRATPRGSNHCPRNLEKWNPKPIISKSSSATTDSIFRTRRHLIPGTLPRFLSAAKAKIPIGQTLESQATEIAERGRSCRRGYSQRRLRGPRICTEPVVFQGCMALPSPAAAMTLGHPIHRAEPRSGISHWPSPMSSQALHSAPSRTR
ncbi:hypothetical protein BJX68DRAFT_199008 [Aspergillus pseudodeflectus]|uniref:Uncharacterized protein n=1 Tax=Aspergillus pseudodeflectus TaxID=176178 RepID=A0ABR4JHL2_9EURO